MVKRTACDEKLGVGLGTRLSSKVKGECLQKISEIIITNFSLTTSEIS